MYSLIIKNGTVIEPVTGSYQKKDLYVKNGRFVDPDHGTDSAIAERELDAEGYFIAPGFIEAHAHAFEGKLYRDGVNADLTCIPNGVTTLIDAGTSGYYNFEQFYETSIFHSKTTIKALLHVSPLGTLFPVYEETVDPNIFSVEQMKLLFETYGNVIRGLKIRTHGHSTGALGLEPLIKTIEMAEEIEREGFKCNVTVHFGELYGNLTIDDVANLLRPGDVMTHFLCGVRLDSYFENGELRISLPPSKDQAFDESGKVRESIKDARKRGVLFDMGFSSVWYTLNNIDRALADNFYPDMLGTDLTTSNLYKEPLISQVNMMSLFLNKGMPLEQVIKAVTYTPAKTYGFLNEAGTLDVGKKADVTVFKLTEKETVHKDKVGGSFMMKELITPMATIKAGKVLFRQVFF